jgi:hypothetical protein
MQKLALVVLVGCGGGQSPGPDANLTLDDGGNRICLEDDAFEPNDLPRTAFETGLGAEVEDISLLGELCPDGDLDFWAFEAPGVGLLFEATLTPDAGATAVMTLMTGGSTVLAQGEPTANPGELAISFRPPSGRLLVQVGGNERHGYRLRMSLRP